MPNGNIETAYRDGNLLAESNHDLANPFSTAHNYPFHREATSKALISLHFKENDFSKRYHEMSIIIYFQKSEKSTRLNQTRPKANNHHKNVRKKPGVFGCSPNPKARNDISTNVSFSLFLFPNSHKSVQPNVYRELQSGSALNYS